MPPLGDDLRLLAALGHRLARGQDRRRRLHREAHHHVLTRGNPAKDAASVVRAEDRTVRPHGDLVGVLGAGQRGRRHAFADFHRLHRVDRHHRRREIGVELAVDRRTQPGRHAARRHLDHRTDAVTRLAQPVEVVRPPLGRLCIRAPERVAGDLLPVEARPVDGLRAHLHHVAGDLQPRCQFGQRRARQTARRHPRRGLARRGAATAAIVANAVFLEIGDVGVARSELCSDLGIVLRALVGVLDHQLHRRAGGLPFEHARKDLHRVGLAPLGGVLVLPRLAQVEPILQRSLVDRHARRAAVHRGTKCRSVALSPGGHAEEMAEGVEAHGRVSCVVPSGCKLAKSRAAGSPFRPVC